MRKLITAWKLSCKVSKEATCGFAQMAAFARTKSYVINNLPRVTKMNYHERRLNQQSEVYCGSIIKQRLMGYQGNVQVQNA